MYSIAITDVDGNTINNSNEPFIFLHVIDISLFIEEIDTSICNQKDFICRFKSNIISYSLDRLGLDSKKYAPLGHLWFKSEEHIDKAYGLFLLANTDKSVSVFPSGYQKIRQYGDGYIWKPLAPQGYTPIGYLYSNKKPSVRQVRVIASKYVKKINYNNCVGMNCSMNKYNYLGQNDRDKYTLNIKHKKIINSIKRPIQPIDQTKYDWNDTDSISNTSESTESEIPTGKYVVLVEPDEPWFVKNNRSQLKNSKKIKINRNIPIKDLKGYTPEQKYGNFTTNFEPDYSKPDLGYGYSYKSRLYGNNCECEDRSKENRNIYETFDGKQQKKLYNFGSILISLFLLIVIILAIRLYLDRKN